ncbi:MAG: choline/carnitine O-acyltransferase [Myxococcaceae bacterium]
MSRKSKTTSPRLSTAEVDRLGLLAIQFIWAMSYVLSKPLVQTFPPLIWVCIKSSLAGLLLLTFAILSKRPHPNFSRDFFVPVTLFALLGGVLTQCFFLLGLRYTTSTNSAVLYSLTPLLTLLIVVLFGFEKATRRQLVGVGISLLGVLVFCHLEEYKLISTTLWGDSLTLFSCICYAAFLALSKDFFKKHDPVWITAWIFILTALWVPLFAYNDILNFSWPTMTPALWIAAIYSVLIATLLGYFLVVWAVRHHPASRVAQFEYLQPILAAILAYFILNEKLTLQSWLGGAAILAGVALSTNWRPLKSWTDACMQNFYLSNRRSISFYSNVFYLFEDDPACQSAVDRATALILSALKFYHANPSNYLFSTSRIPHDKKDQVRQWKSQSHLIISVLGQFYCLELSQLSASHLKKTLITIIQDAQISKPEPTVGLLTTLPRQKWSEIYTHLNQENLKTIQSALLFVAIDLNTAPQNREEKVKAVAHQNPENRWYDKSHQIIVFKNGKAGLNRDHTMIDGQACAAYVSKVHQEALVKNLSAPTGEVLEYKKLKWGSNPKLELEIKNATNLSQDELSQRELISFDILTTSKISDAAFQIVIQLAAYKHFGKFMSVSESVSMGHFPGGRYDTILCTTPESKQFILNPRVKNLESAITAHKKLVKESKQGNNSFKGFCDITTSHPGYLPGYELGGYTDTDPNIIGINYLILPDKIQVFIKTDHQYFGSANALKKELLGAYKEVLALRNASIISV